MIVIYCFVYVYEEQNDNDKWWTKNKEKNNFEKMIFFFNEFVVENTNRYVFACEY